MAQVGMPECRGVAVELLPVRFRDQRLHVFEQRRSGKWRQNLEERSRGTQIDGIVDCGANALHAVG